MDATDRMAADERIHGEVLRGLAARGRVRLSGTFRAAVFGANDGLVSNLALVLGIGATGAGVRTILFTGLAGLLAGALSMGAGEYVSVRSQRELLQSTQPDPESQSALPHLDVDANELALVYRARGMEAPEAEEHARTVLATLHLEPVAPEAVGVDPHEAVGSAWQAAVSSFCFRFRRLGAGAAVPVRCFGVGRGRYRRRTGRDRAARHRRDRRSAVRRIAAQAGVAAACDRLRRGGRHISLGPRFRSHCELSDHGPATGITLHARTYVVVRHGKRRNSSASAWVPDSP